MIKIGILDDHELIRDGFSRLINNQEDMILANSFSESSELFVKVNEIEIEILVLDISLPRKNGLDVLKELKILKPDLSILILSMHSEEQYAIRALQNGASGFISKGSDSRTILDAIRKIHNGGIYVSPLLSEKMASNIQTPKIKLSHEQLSEREFQILCLIGDGLSSKDIANKLFISENTVRTYRRRILTKLALHSTAELIKYAVENELFTNEM